MKSRIMKLIAMGIISFSLISNNIITFATEPEVIEAPEQNNENQDAQDIDNNNDNENDNNDDDNLDTQKAENENENEIIEQNDENNSEDDQAKDEIIEQNNENLDTQQTENEVIEQNNDDNPNIQITETENEEVIEYHEEITDIPTEEEKDKIVEEKTQEQEEIKQDITNQDGTYDYTITVETITLEREVSEEAESEEAAEELAEEVNGTVETEIVNSTENSTTVVVETEEEVETVVEEIVAAAPSNVEREIKNVETEEVSGVSAEQVDEKGYHIDENEDGSFTIVVTGGLDEIEIDFAWFSSIQLMYPGDEINASFTLVNESGDKYEVTGYEKKTDGPYRYSTTASFNEEWGTPVTTFTDGRGRECTAYVPNEILKINGRDIDRGTLEIMYKQYADKTMRERREIAKNLTEDDLLEYYNEQMGTDYENAFEAWQANLNDRLWTTTYTKNGEEETYGEDFWTSVDLTTNAPVNFTMKASLDGLGTDNLYQMTVWEFVELLKLKAIPNVAVTVDYIDNEIKYIVNYTVEETKYTVEIDGNGVIPKKVEPVPTPEPEIIPEPIEPTPEPITPTPTPEPVPEPKPEIIPTPIPTPIVEPVKPEPIYPIPHINPDPILPEKPNEEEERPNNPEPEETIYIEEEEVVPLIDIVPPVETPSGEVLGATRTLTQDKQVLGAARKAETGDNKPIYRRNFVIFGCLILIAIIIIFDIDKRRKS